MSPPRKILHLDLDAFFCAVEENDRPALQGKPFAVGGSPKGRGVVASCSYAARKYGVRSAMPMAQAYRLCSDLIVVNNRHKVYSAISHDVMDFLRRKAAKVEQISIDEAFINMSVSPKPEGELARRLQMDIQQNFKLPYPMIYFRYESTLELFTDTFSTPCFFL